MCDAWIFSLQDRVPDFTCTCTSTTDQSRAKFCGGPMDIQHLSRISGDITTIIFGVENWRSREHHQSLSLRVGIIQRLIFIQLGLSLLRRGSLRLDCHSRRIGADSSLLWLFLPLHYQSTEGQEATTTCLASVKNLLSSLYWRKVRLPVFGVDDPR